MRTVRFKKRLAVVLSLVLFVSLLGHPVVAKTAKKPTVSKMITVDIGDTENINIKANGYTVKQVYAFPIGKMIKIKSVSKKAIVVEGVETGMAKVRVFVSAKKKKGKAQLFAYYTDVAILEANIVEPSATPIPTKAPTPTPVKTEEPTKEPKPSGPCTIVVNNIQDTLKMVTVTASSAMPGDTFTVTVKPVSGEFGTYHNPYPSIRASYYTGYTYEHMDTVGTDIKEKDICEKTFKVPNDIVPGSQITVNVN